MAEFIRRLVFNALIGNADMHLKNWSLMYPDQKNAVLAPGYDFVSTIAYIPDTNMALKLGRSKAMRDLSLDQLSYMAGKARVPEKLVLGTAKETVERFMDIWRDGYISRVFNSKSIDEINKLLGLIPLARISNQAD